jgi:hypothetical protein
MAANEILLDNHVTIPDGVVLRGLEHFKLANENAWDKWAANGKQRDNHVTIPDGNALCGLEQERNSQ